MHSRSQYIIKELIEHEVLNEQIMHFNKLEMIGFEKVFQCVLYFVGIANTSLNQEHTNKIDWRKAKSFWKPEVLQTLHDYTPFGPKPKHVQFFALVNRQLEAFEALYGTIEEIKEYNYSLSKLVEFMYLSKLIIFIYVSSHIEKRRC